MGCEFTSLISPKTGHESRLANLLFNALNNNKIAVMSVYETAILDDGFKLWFTNNGGFEYSDDQIDGRRISVLIRKVREYQNKFEFRVTHDRVGYKKTNRVFDNVDEEIHGIKILVNMYLDAEDFLIGKGKEVTIDNLKKVLLARLVKHYKTATLTNNQKKHIGALVNSVNTEDQLFKDVLRNPKVIELSKSFRFITDNELNDSDEAITINDLFDDEGVTKSWDDSQGEKRDINKTITKEVRKLFNTTKKLNSVERVDEAYDYANDTYSGIAENIDFIDYFNTIIRHGNFNSYKEFIDSLKEIARINPDKIALIQIIDKLNADQNLGFKVYNTFNQPVVKRLSSKVVDGVSEPNVDNISAQPNGLLRNNMFRQINNSRGVQLTYLYGAISEIEALIKNDKLNESIKYKGIEYNNVEDLLSECFDYLNLGIAKDTVNSYIQFEEGDYKDKLSTMFSMFKNLVQELDSYNNTVRFNNGNAKEAYKNYMIKKSANDQAGVETAPFDKASIPYIEPMTSRFKSLVLKASDMLAKYDNTIKTEYNSKNVEGESVSDVIKHSYITKFFQRLKDEGAATEYFNIKRKLNQYINSNIILEQTDGKGNITIPGMLREVNGEYVLTPYYKFLDLSLYNGAKNDTLGKNATYAKSSQRDIDITALSLFSNLTDGEPNYHFTSDVKTNKKVRVASYFIQTPSDAPKTFTIDSYRLDIAGLFNTDKTVNHNHPIYKAFQNIIQQEIVDMRQAFEYIFERDADGNFVYEENTDPNEFGKPARLKQNNVSLISNYHHKGGAVVDAKGKLTGNVFQFWNTLLDFTSSDARLNLNVLVDDSTNDSSVTVEGMKKLLYGRLSEEMFNDYLDNYLRTKANEAVKYFGQYKDSFLSSENPTETDITNFNNEVASFALNYTIQYTNFTQLFTGNPKFYKDWRDTIKRNKEAQGSGIAYGAFDIRNNNNDVIDVITIGDKQIEITPSFSYVTVKNTIKASNNVDSIKKILKKSDAPAYIVDFILDKYSSASTKTNDAQSYITLDEFVRRVYLAGEYDNFKDTIEALYDESKPIDYKELSRLIQVQKNFYYDLSLIDEYNMELPVQIKNAEFVLIPRLLGNSELAEVARLMEAEGIAQLNTAEAEKASIDKVMTLWDDKGRLTVKGFNAFKKDLKGNIKSGRYSNLYKQQDVQQHMDGKNKAGVQIVKKMLDNLTGDKGKAQRERFFDLFTANIEESYETLLDELGLEIDDNGYVKLDDNGEIKVDSKKFYSLIEDEFNRLGVDSNMRDYATVDEFGQPIMPNYMPMVRKKIMSVFQSIFTNNVTNQKLPGFHAAQVTNVGFEKFKVRSQTKDNSAFRKLQYNADPNDPYVEVLIPLWNKELLEAKANIGEDALIEALNKSELLDMIGYRIPTEGKQSVVRMKVVGFLDETLGSTIVVPDEFVTQTGADFDVDSVYAIYKEFSISPNGKVNNYIYSEEDSEEATFSRYVSYVNSNIDKAIRKKYEVRTDETEINTLKAEYRKFIEESQKEQADFLTSQVKDLIAKENKIYKGASQYIQNVIKAVDNLLAETKQDISYYDKLYNYIGALEKAKTLEGADLTGADELIKTYEAIHSIQELQKDFNQEVYELYRSSVGEELASLFKDNFRKAIAKRADEAGLMTIDEFSKLPIIKQNSRKARNNAILDTFLDIMKDPKNSEENFMSSNFDDIKTAKAKVYKALGKDVEWIDANSYIGQANYRNQVMSGAVLKAISVKRDGFVSISNVAETTISDKLAIKVKYDLTTTPVEKLRQIYTHVTDDGIVTHNMLGWSKNNRNIEGKLLTVYSSETTALILDGVKEGGIMNVNTYTFDVFKTLIDVGIDYETAIAFIVQPGITAINEANDNINSIYADSTFNPIGAASRNLIMNYLDSKGIEYNKYDKLEMLMSKAGITEIDKDSPLDLNELYFNLNPNNDSYSALVAQLAIINKFRNYKMLADAIGAHAGVMNTDKFGAGQSIFEVNNLINKIDKLKAKTAPVLLSNKTGDSLIKAVYPDRTSDDNNKESVYKRSVYPSLYAQLINSAIGSKVINSSMFVTENRNFTRLKSFLPDNVDEDTMNAFENYVVARELNNTTFVQSNVSRDGSINITPYEDLDNRKRIYGYDQAAYISFEDLFGTSDYDINNPSEKQKIAFMNLSPANKAYLLQRKLKGNSLLTYIKVELKDSRKEAKRLKSGHKLIVEDKALSPEQMYELYRDLYYKDNFYLTALADDLIRYAIVVEGLQYNHKFVSKVIPNEVLYNSTDDNGTNIINEVNRQLNEMNPDSEAVAITDAFFRQYNESKSILKIENKYNKDKKAANIIFKVNTNVAYISVDEAVRLGIYGEVGKREELDPTNLPLYIKTNIYKSKSKRDKGRIKLDLFKPLLTMDEKTVVLIPINPLERNEVSSDGQSVNTDNNIYARERIYRRLLPSTVNKETKLYNKKLASLDKITLNRNRSMVNMLGFGDNKMFNDYINIIRDGSITDDGANNSNVNSFMSVTVTGLNRKVKNALTKAINNKTTLAVVANNETIRVLEFLESKGYSNYIVYYTKEDDQTVAIKNFIREKDKQDKINEFNKREADVASNIVELNTTSNSFKSFKANLEGSYANNLFNRVMSDGVNFTTVTSLLASNIGFNEHNKAIYEFDGRKYLLTNLGVINKSNYKKMPEYLTNSEDGAIIEALAQTNAYSPILIKIEDYDAVVNAELENDLLNSNDSENDASINAFITDMVKTVNATLSVSDSKIVKDVKKALRKLEVDRNNKVSLNDASRAISLSTIGLFIEQRTNDLFASFNDFAGYSINDPKLYEVMIDNPELQRAFCQLLLDVSEFINDNKIINRVEKYSKHTIDNAKDEAERRALLDNNESIEKIKELFKEVNTLRNRADAARDMFFDKVISTLSTNPLIKAELQSIIKPYKDESYFQLWFTDSQESNVAIMQIVLKDVMTKLYASETAAIEKIVAFKKRLNEIKAIDPNISISSIINEDGKLLMEFTEAFLDDRRLLKENAEVAKHKYGVDSSEYNKAYRAYENWLTDNIERRYVAEMYNELEAIDAILDNYPEGLKKLKAISVRRAEILASVIGNDYSTLTEAELKEIKALNRSMNELANPVLPSGEYKPNAEEAIAIGNYLEAKGKFEKKYYTKDEKEGFRDSLNKHLATIDLLEHTLTLEELENSLDYKKAKNWVNANTSRVLDPVFKTELEQAFSFISDPEGNKIFKDLSKDKYDEFGIINGNLFSEEDVAKINRLNKSSIAASGAMDSTVRLVTPRANEDTRVFTPEFYKILRGNKPNTVARREWISEINEIILKCYDVADGKIKTALLSLEDINRLNYLYNELDAYDETFKASPEKAKFIKDNIEFITDDELYEEQQEAARRKGMDYYYAWAELNNKEYEQYETVTNSKGFKATVRTLEYEPNRHIYSTMQVSEDINDKFIDKSNKAWAIQYLNKNVDRVETKYYKLRKRQEFAKGRESYDKWFKANHVFDFNKGYYVPIKIWQQTIYKKPGVETITPRSSWMNRTVKEEFNNPNYNEDSMTMKQGNTKYRNAKYDQIRSTEAGRQMYDLITSILDEVVIDKRSKRFVKQGNIPTQLAEANKEGFKDYRDAILRSIGIYDTPMKSETEEQFGKRNVNMPMLHRLQQTPMLQIRHKGDNETEAEYAAYLEETYAANRIIKKQNDEAHVKAANPNYEETFINFIREAMKFNSIQESAILMRLTLEELRAFEYIKHSSKGSILYNKSRNFITGKNEAITQKGNNAAEHFETQLKKLVYNEFELDQGNWSKLSRVARSITSAKFMMLNLTGGVSNITMGESQIFMEALAKEFLGSKDYAKGLADYKDGISAFFRNSDSAQSDNLVDALIKRIDVLNLDSATDIAGGKENDLARRAMNYLYFQQSAGEHMMQNSTMLGMMISHRVYKDADGKGKLVTYNQFVRDYREDVLRDVLSKYDAANNTNLLEGFNKFVEDIKTTTDIESRQKYVDFTRDLVTEYLKTQDINIKKDFTESYKNKKAELKTIFEDLPTFREQFELVDGLAKLKDDSGLNNEDVARFRYKVISVNHKIHGIYDKVGAAKAQGHWAGSVAFQFHKHLVPGWAKRWGYVFGKGVYNEAREEVDKGSYISLYQFLTTPIRDAVNYKNSEELKAIEAWRKFGTELVDFTMNARVYYNILPEYDKANIRRCLAEIATILAALTAFIAARFMWDEDEEDTQVADYLMYWSDRLASEAQQYTPVGAIQEGKKLYSNPVAAFANVKDMMNVFETVTNYMFTGDKEKLYYQSGSLSGEHRLGYALQKQLPIWNQVLKHNKLGKNNSYYKTGNNIIGALPIRDWIDTIKD